MFGEGSSAFRYDLLSREQVAPLFAVFVVHKEQRAQAHGTRVQVVQHSEIWSLDELATHLRHLLKMIEASDRWPAGGRSDCLPRESEARAWARNSEAA